MQNKTKKTKSAPSQEKTKFYQAGEIIGSIGFEVATAKDTIVNVISKDIKIVKKAIKKRLPKSKVASTAKAGKAELKRAVKKVAGATKKTIRKASKKAVPKKALLKKIKKVIRKAKKATKK